MNKVARAGGALIDWYYEPDSVTKGRRHFDAMLIPMGIELWAGRRHLILEAPGPVRLWRRVARATPLRPSPVLWAVLSAGLAFPL